MKYEKIYSLLTFCYFLLFFNAPSFAQETSVVEINQCIVQIKESQSKLKDMMEGVSSYLETSKNTQEELKKLLEEFKQKRGLTQKTNFLEQVTLNLYRLSESLENCELNLINSSDVYQGANGVFSQLIEVCSLARDHWNSEYEKTEKEYKEIDNQLKDLTKEVNELLAKQPNLKNVKTVEAIMNLSVEDQQKLEELDNLRAEFDTQLLAVKRLEDRKDRICPTFRDSYERAKVEYQKVRLSWGRSEKNKDSLGASIDYEEKRLADLVEFTKEQVRLGQLEVALNNVTEGLKSLAEIHIELSSLLNVILDYARVPGSTISVDIISPPSSMPEQEKQEYYKKYGVGL